MADSNYAGKTMEGDKHMSRTWKDRKGYKTKQHYPSYTTMNYQNRIRGGYEDYDHSDEELYVYDQSCENCCYFGGNDCANANREDDDPDSKVTWCEAWRGYGGGRH